MKKIFLTTLVFLFTVLPVFVSAQKEYTLLEPSVYNNTYNTTGSKSFSEYLNLVFKIGIGVAAGLAVIQIVIGGIQYMASESPFKLGDAKSKIEGAILGLILALGVYVFLYTINPDIVSLKLEIPQTKVVSITTTSATTSTSPSRSSTGVIPEKACIDCTFIPPELKTKAGACGSKTCRANKKIIENLIMLKNSPSVSSIAWQITEAYPPTYPHKSSCHNDGGCVDMNLIAGVNKSTENINALCVAARKVGLKPFYEVKTAAEKDSLANGGVTCVRAVPEISAAHFHVEY